MKLFEFEDLKIQIKPSVNTLVIFQTVTGKDLFAKLQEMEDTKISDAVFFFDVLFCLAYGADKNLNYTEFTESLPLSLAGNGKFYDKINKILLEEFKIDVDEDVMKNFIDKKKKKKKNGKK